VGIGLPGKGLDQQRLRWRDRLSVKQARIAVGLTLLIGLLFSGIQIVWDLREEQNLIDRTVNQVLATLRESATQAAYGLDETLAARVISGLFEYEPVYEAELRDNFKNVLARKTEQPINSNRTFLTFQVCLNMSQSTRPSFATTSKIFSHARPNSQSIPTAHS